MSLNKAVRMAREFHKRIGAPIASQPQLLGGAPKEAQFLAARLRNVEGLARKIAPYDPMVARLALAVEELAEWTEAYVSRDLVAAADAWADRAYVLMGDAVACGFPAEELFAEVHRSNLTKQFGVRTGLGKAYRGHQYEPPKIREILERYREPNPNR
ncbi:MAG: hypothetical protein GXX96_01155 [Planctomycetaceae bacterium]|nr:hypothetical protein [Planctomycetaceae bacterium]